jgi:hypothetical protein
VDAAGAALGGLDLDLGGAAPRGALDLPRLVAPLLLLRSPAAQSLFWKVAVVGGGGGGEGSGGGGGAPALQRSLLRWLGVQLSGGRVAASPSGAAHLQGPVSLSVNGAAGAAELLTCVALPPAAAAGPPPAGSAALAGAAGVILATAAPGAASAVAEVLRALPAGAPPVPLLVLVVAAAAAAAAAAGAQADDGAALPQLQASVERLAPGRAVRVMSVSDARAPSASPAGAPFSAPALVQGLRWLAGNAPPQPALSVTRLEDAARDALTAALGPLLRAAQNDPAAVQPRHYEAAFGRALDAVAAALDAAAAAPAAAWRWPPPEACSGPLLDWHAPATWAKLHAALDALRRGAPAPSPPGLPAAAAAGDAAVALHARLGALAAAPPPPALVLVLPPEALHAFSSGLEAAQQAEHAPRGAAPAPLEDRDGGGAWRAKRKWRHSPDASGLAGAQRSAAAAARAPAGDSLRAGLAALLEELPEERGLMRRFAAGAAGAAGGGGEAAPPQEAPEGGAGAADSAGGGLRRGPVAAQLVLEVAEERRAAESVWARVRSMAAAAWLF